MTTAADLSHCANAVPTTIAYPMYSYTIDEVKVVAQHINACPKCNAKFFAAAKKYTVDFSDAAKRYGVELVEISPDWFDDYKTPVQDDDYQDLRNTQEGARPY